MFSIILDNYRIQLAKLFINSLSSDNYYIFISRSGSWSTEEYAGTQTSDINPPAAFESLDKLNSIYNNMIAIKKLDIGDVFNVVPKFIWEPNVQFDSYAHNYSPTNPSSTGAIRLNSAKFYVINSLFQVFKCIYNNKSPENPVGTNTGVGAEPIVTGNPTAIITTADGYKWKFMYQISPDEILNFSTAEYIPVKINPIISTAAIAGVINQINIKKRGINLIPGTYYTPILGDGSGGVVELVIPNNLSDPLYNKLKYINIINAGINYTTANIDLGAVYSDITMQTISTCGVTNSDYTYAEVIIPPAGGHGSNPISELGSYRILINGVLDSIDGSGDIPIGVSFRQFGLLFNPNKYNTTTPYVLPSASTAYALKLPNTFTGTILPGAYLDQTNTNATGVVLTYDNTTKIVKYLLKPNSTGNTVKFSGNTNILVRPSTNGGNIVSFSVDIVSGDGTIDGTVFTSGYGNPEVDVNSGTIIYYENRVPINRSLDQIENVKLVVEF